MKKSTLPVASLALKLNYFIFLFLMVFLFSSQLPAFSQVKVLIKCGGTFIEKEFKSYAECGCQEWAYDTYKCSLIKFMAQIPEKPEKRLKQSGSRASNYLKMMNAGEVPIQSGVLKYIAMIKNCVVTAAVIPCRSTKNLSPVSSILLWKV